MAKRTESIHFDDDIPINLQAQTLTHAIIDKIQYLLTKLDSKTGSMKNDLQDIDAFANDLNHLMINNPKDFNSSEQDYIGSIFSASTKLAQSGSVRDSKSLIIIEANAQTLLTQLQKSA